ncbi:MAG: hypothetical protein ACREHC_07900 [Candidatus Levyibacteriota bacterium]
MPKQTDVTPEIEQERSLYNRRSGNKTLILVGILIALVVVLSAVMLLLL